MISMFEPSKPRYMTRAVAEELPEEQIQFIIKYLQDYQDRLTDYLQVFEFYIENKEQFLIQRQEVPNRETTIFVPLKECKPINRTVWAMDQNDHVMVLFPKDY